MKRRFSTRKNDPIGGVKIDSAYDIIVAHQDSFLMVGVAETAVEIASGKPYEYSRITCMMTLSLEGIEYLVYLLHCSQSF